MFDFKPGNVCNPEQNVCEALCTIYSINLINTLFH